MSAPLLRGRFDRAELAREFSKDERGADLHEVNLQYVEALSMADRHPLHFARYCERI